MALESVLSRAGIALVPVTGSAPPALHHGQVLTARVDALLPNGAVRIASPAGSLEAQAPFDLRPGTMLRLQVLGSGRDLKLMLLDPVPADAAGSGRAGQPLSGAIRTAASAQGSLAPLLANASAAKAFDGAAFPDPVRAVIEQLAGLRLPAGGRLDGDAVRHALLNSGLFYEAKLAAGASPALLGGDMKAVLLALQAGLRAWLGGETPTRPGAARTAPPMRGGGPAAGGGAAAPSDLAALSSPQIAQLLLAQTGAALARLRLAQFASLPDETDGTRSARSGSAAEWTFELPFALGEETAMIQFRLSREPAPGGSARETVWRIRFSLDIEPLGPLHAAITWQHQRVSVSLWAETDDGARRLRRESDALGAALDSADLAVERIQVLTGRPRQGQPAAGAFVDRVT